MANAAGKENEPSLEDWMAKIREKKLRPVVPNQHKSKDQPADRAQSVRGPFEVNELSKMRQGLRSVSTPKWPGANDVKKEINTSVLPQRSQLRSVSDRTSAGPTNSAIPTQALPTFPQKSGEVAKDKKQGSGNDTAEDVKETAVETVTASEATLLDDKKEASESGEPANKDPLATSDTGPNDVFPLDIVGECAEDGTGGVEVCEEPSASSGVTKSNEAVTLTLPAQKGDDVFPLDLEEKDAAAAHTADDESATPVTLSSGVFEPDSGVITLNLPGAKAQDDFPLDHETLATPATPTAGDEESPAPTRSTDVTLSQGVIDSVPASVPLELPADPKKNNDKRKKKKKKKIAVESPSTQADVVDDSACLSHACATVDKDVAPVISQAKSDESSESSPDNDATREDRDASAATDMQPLIKCARCSIDIALTELDIHQCQEAATNGEAF